MPLPRFSRPKGPGFGIAPGTYLSVLISRSVLPSPVEVAQPKGLGGAVEAFLVPLRRDADKDELARPMTRGVYALSSLDRRTVIRLMVMSRDEAGFDPEPFVRSALALETGPEAVARIRGAWTIVQANFESHDPAVYPALDLLIDATTRLAELGEGVVADPLAERYRLPSETRVLPRSDPRVDARDHVAVRLTGGGAATRGLRKFSHPEIALADLDDGSFADAARMLMAIAQTVLLGRAVKDGERYGADGWEFEIRPAIAAALEGLPTFELLPPTGRTSGECLRAWAAAGYL